MGDVHSKMNVDFGADITCPDAGHCSVCARGERVFSGSTLKGFSGTGMELSTNGKRSAWGVRINCDGCKSIFTDVQGIEAGTPGVDMKIDESGAHRLSQKARQCQTTQLQNPAQNPITEVPTTKSPTTDHDASTT